MPPKPAWAPPVPRADLVLYRASYWRSLKAGLQGAAIIFAGLLVLGLGKLDLYGHGLPVLFSRVLAVLTLVVVPLQGVAIMNFRCLAMYGLQPSKRQPVSFSVAPLKIHARSRGLHTWRAALAPCAFHACSLLGSSVMLMVPVGLPREHLGLVFGFLVMMPLIVVAGDAFIVWCLPMLDHTWGTKSGPFCSGASFMGFVFVVIGFVLSRGAVDGKWLGAAMASLLCACEVAALSLHNFVFRRYYLMAPRACQACLGTQQSMYVCIAVGMLHNAVESARLLLVIYDAQQSGGISSTMVTASAGLASNLAVRSGLLQRAVAHLSRGSLCQTNLGLLLQDMKFQLGYVRFLAVAPIAAVRAVLGCPALPGAAVGWATLVCLVVEAVEDALVLLVARLGLNAKPAFSSLTEEQALDRARAGRVCCPRSFRQGLAYNQGTPVVPEPAAPPSQEERQFADLFLQAHRWSTTELSDESSPSLPQWAHFSAVYTGMCLLVCAMILVFGVDFVLGFSGAVPGPAEARAVLWWPLPTADGQC
uniref:Uncharacterized protein n=1 Tax=Alexandrium monilatum TaxID=311494 RepID=A0A7S4RB54_9DINO